MTESTNTWKRETLYLGRQRRKMEQRKRLKDHRQCSQDSKFPWFPLRVFPYCQAHWPWPCCPSNLLSSFHTVKMFGSFWARVAFLSTFHVVEACVFFFFPQNYALGNMEFLSINVTSTQYHFIGTCFISTDIKMHEQMIWVQHLYEQVVWCIY